MFIGEDRQFRAGHLLEEALEFVGRAMFGGGGLRGEDDGVRRLAVVDQGEGTRGEGQQDEGSGLLHDWNLAAIQCMPWGAG